MRVLWALRLLAALDVVVAPVDFLQIFPTPIYVTAPGAPLGGLNVHQHLFSAMGIPVWVAAAIMGLPVVIRSWVLWMTTSTLGDGPRGLWWEGGFLAAMPIIYPGVQMVRMVAGHAWDWTATFAAGALPPGAAPGFAEDHQCKTFSVHYLYRNLGNTLYIDLLGNKWYEYHLYVGQMGSSGAISFECDPLFVPPGGVAGAPWTDEKIYHFDRLILGIRDHYRRLMHWHEIERGAGPTAPGGRIDGVLDGFGPTTKAGNGVRTIDCIISNMLLPVPGMPLRDPRHGAPLPVGPPPPVGPHLPPAPAGPPPPAPYVRTGLVFPAPDNPTMPVHPSHMDYFLQARVQGVIPVTHPITGINTPVRVRGPSGGTPGRPYHFRFVESTTLG